MRVNVQAITSTWQDTWISSFKVKLVWNISISSEIED
jgi:hypothetical protein